MSELGPIFRAAARRRSAFLFIVVEVALGLACVVLCVEIALFLVFTDKNWTGAELDRVVAVAVHRIGAPDPAGDPLAVLSRLRAVDGVEVAAWVSAPPHLGDLGPLFAKEPDGNRTIVWAMTGTEGVLDALGMRVTEGRAFLPEDHAAAVPSAVVSRELARRIVPGGSALGATLELGRSSRATIVGVVEELYLKPPGYPDASCSAVLTGVPAAAKVASYVLRGDPGKLDQLQTSARAAASDDGHFAVTTDLGEHYRREANESAGAFVAGGVALAMLVVIMLGSAGTASFLVSERTRQIGVRRALGATRGDVLRYFLLENFLVTSVGIALGIPLVTVLYLLTAPKLGLENPIWLLAPMGVGMILFWGTGLLAALFPALRASRIPPIAATRSL